MKLIGVVGNSSGAGKTTVSECIIKELKKRGYSVGAVKEIHYEAFTLETEGKNTWRLRNAGADTVTARGYNETDIMYSGMLAMDKILAHYDNDYVIMEGVRDTTAPLIVVCKEDETPQVDEYTVAISGRYANNHSGNFMGVPIISAIENIDALMQLIL